MCRIAHDKTHPAIIAAYVGVGSDAAHHSPTLRWKLKTPPSPGGSFFSLFSFCVIFQNQEIVDRRICAQELQNVDDV